MNQFKIPRCLTPQDFAGSTNVELHHFSDASDLGYGVVSYARVLDVEGRVHCNLLMSRSRVNPVKKMTVPRLELTASTVAVRINSIIQEHLGIELHYDLV